MISTASNTIGALLRWYGGSDYSMALAGQAFAAVAQSCILQLPAGK